MDAIGSETSANPDDFPNKKLPSAFRFDRPLPKRSHQKIGVHSFCKTLGFCCATWSPSGQLGETKRKEPGK